MTIAQLPTNYLTGAQTARLVKEEKASVGQVVENHLKRYDARDDAIQAWAYFDKERVKAEAKRLDAVPVGQRGPLHGIILGVKDMMRAFSSPECDSLNCADHNRYKRSVEMLCFAFSLWSDRQICRRSTARRRTRAISLKSTPPP